MGSFFVCFEFMKENFIIFVKNAERGKKISDCELFHLCLTYFSSRIYKRKNLLVKSVFCLCQNA